MTVIAAMSRTMKNRALAPPFGPLLCIAMIVLCTACGQQEPPLDANVPENSRALTKDSVVFTSIHFRQKTLSENNITPAWHPVREWTPVSRRIQENFWRTRSQPLTPFDEIRLLIVLDKSLVDKGPYEIGMQLRLLPLRNDIQPHSRGGPSYTATTRVLTEADFLPTDFADESDKQRMVGSIGVVFYPQFTIGKKTFLGTRPLGDVRDREGEPWTSYHRDRLLAYYSYAITVGGNPRTRQFMSIGWQDGKRSAINAYPVDIQEKRRHRIRDKKRRLRPRYPEFYFINREVLWSKSENLPYTHLLDKFGKTWLFLRIRDEHKQGMKNFISPDKSFATQIAEEAENLKQLGIGMRFADGVLYLDNYDWRYPIELGVLVNSGDQASYKYDQVELNYLNLPVQATLSNFLPKRPGPGDAVVAEVNFQSRLVNFGEKLFLKGEYIYRREERTRKFRIRRDMDSLIQGHVDTLLPERPAGNRYRYLYGARVVIDQASLVNGLSPSRHIQADENGYYRFYTVFDTGPIGFQETLKQYPIYIKPLHQLDVHGSAVNHGH